MQFRRLAAAVLATGALMVGAASAGTAAGTPGKPNILFIVLDDVGIDQMTAFGFGGIDAPRLPMLNSLSQQGVRFRNTWSMPSCSTTRATFFDGRYPFRTNVLDAILSEDLANSQVSPFESLTPQLLHKAGYKSALIGKMHLSGTNLAPQNNPFGNAVMKKLGWDYFAGWLDGGPYPIDTTAGGMGSDGQYSCGFIPGSVASAGACRQADGSCTQMGGPGATPGFDCMASGGVLEPGATCTNPPSRTPNFDTQNAYYTGQLIVDGEDGSVTEYAISNPNARKYRTVLETDYARDWINKQPRGQSWMLSLGYSTNHAPLQQAPRNLLPPEDPVADGYDCTNPAQQRILSNQALEAADHEIRRLLLETGIAVATRQGIKIKPDGNTYVIVIGDNGTYGPTVKTPFNPERAKGTVYQGGVWVPLIVAGPGVVLPGRTVQSMVNSADLYSLFAEIGNVNLKTSVPKSRIVDAQSMMAYLKSASAPSVRTTNFSEMGKNIQEPGNIVYPCVIKGLNVCTQIFVQQKLCEDEGGVWYGPGAPHQFTTCCEVSTYLEQQSPAVTVSILPDTQQTVRNDRYKLVSLTSPDCTNGGETTTQEFYRVDQSTPVPKLDNAPSNLLLKPQLSAVESANLRSLQATLAALLGSESSCPGDGNRDGVVDNRDIANYNYFSQLNGGRSSWYDFNHDGLTNQADLDVIIPNLGTRCGPQ